MDKNSYTIFLEPPAAELDIICNDPEPANEHKNESIKADNYENKCVLQKRSSGEIFFLVYIFLQKLNVRVLLTVKTLYDYLSYFVIYKYFFFLISSYFKIRF